MSERRTGASPTTLFSKYVSQEAMKATQRTVDIYSYMYSWGGLDRFGQVPCEAGPNLSEPDLAWLTIFGQVHGEPVQTCLSKPVKYCLYY